MLVNILSQLTTDMRSITDHKLAGLNEAIDITVTDQPGAGGANHEYQLQLRTPEFTKELVTLSFQNGPVADAGFNGVTNEALLAVDIDRMRGFQYARKEDGTFDYDTPGKYACIENAEALRHMEQALYWLQKRTKDRLARGVEGTHQK